MLNQSKKVAIDFRQAVDRGPPAYNTVQPRYKEVEYNKTLL